MTTTRTPTLSSVLAPALDQPALDGIDTVEAPRLVFGRLEQAWNDADGQAFGQAFTDDADFVDIRGDHHPGRTAIALGHQGIFDTIYAGSTVRFEVETARAIAPGVVVALARSTMTAPSGPLKGTNHARMTAVLTQGAEGWAIAAFHNTLRANHG